MSNIQLVEVSSPDGKGSLYRCPLCPIENAYYNAMASKVMDHMRGNKHFGIAVKHRGWLICKCDDLSCENNSNINNNNEGQQKIKSHRHCPHCGRLSSRRNDFTYHVERCCPSLSNHSISSSQQQQNNNACGSTTIKKILQARGGQQQQTKSSSNIIIDDNDDLLPSAAPGQTSTNSQTYIYVINSPPTSDNNNNYSTKRKASSDVVGDLVGDHEFNSKKKNLYNN